jgi:hypothetical protein
MKSLSAQLGKKRVIWRYDPIFLTSLTNIDFHLTNFSDLAGQLSGIVDRVIISIYDEYAGAARRLSALEKEGLCKVYPHVAPDGSLTPELQEAASGLARIAAEAGMEIRTCAEGPLSTLGIKPGACIDGPLIQELLGSEKPISKAHGLRPHCLCAPSIDIGKYGPCPAACVYCYARR